MVTDGFVPMFSCIVSEVYKFDYELCPDLQHCKKGTPDLIKRTLDQIKEHKLTHPILFQLDSGTNAIDTIMPHIAKGEGPRPHRESCRELPGASKEAL
jgi:hypothetical protein